MNTFNLNTLPPFQHGPLVRLALGASLLVLLSACASFSGIGSTAKPRSVESLAASESLKADGETSNAAWPTQQWWQQFGDSQLNALIEEALANSPTMEDAAARVHFAQAYRETARSALYPHVDGGFSAQYQRFTENGLYPPPLAGSFNSSDDLRITASYDLDLWGKNRDGLKTAAALEVAAYADHANAVLTLTSEVASSYLELYRLYGQRDVTERTLQQRQQIFDLTNQRVASGIDSKAELKQAESQLPALRGDMAQLDEAIAANRNALAALLGAGPDRGLTIARPQLTATAVALQLPANLPMELLGRRPDIAVARALVQASEHDIDVGKAEFYPNINLSAFAGFSSIGLGELTRSSSRTYGAGPAISLPIFEGGRLRANLKGKYADYETAVAFYDKSLTTALHDTADQINGLKWLQTRQSEQREAARIANEALDLATQRYKAGLGNYLSVLNAEILVLTEDQLGVELAARSLNLRVNLIKALGGGFEATTATAQNDQPSAQVTAP